MWNDKSRASFVVLVRACWPFVSQETCSVLLGIAERYEPVVSHDAIVVFMETSDQPPTVHAFIEQARRLRDMRETPQFRQRQALAGAIKTEKAPWFIKLQIARMKAGLPAGFPLQEPEDKLSEDCARFDIVRQPSLEGIPL